MSEENNKWLVVVNPKANVGKSGKDWPTIKEILVAEGIEFDAILTEYPRHAIEIVKKGIEEQGENEMLALAICGKEIMDGVAPKEYK